MCHFKQKSIQFSEFLTGRNPFGQLLILVFEFWTEIFPISDLGVFSPLDFFSLYLFAYLFHCFEKKDKKTPYSSQLAPTRPNLSKLIHTCQIVPESRNRVNIRPFWKLNGVFSPSDASYCSNPFEVFHFIFEFYNSIFIQNV